MFDSQRYLTRGISKTVPPELQLFMWNCVDCMPKPKDYFQVFKLEYADGMQKIAHFSEQPEYRASYLIPTVKPVTAKVYIINSIEYSTMLLAEEY